MVRNMREKRTVDISTMNLSNKALKALLVASTVHKYQKRRQRLYSCVKHGNYLILYGDILCLHLI